jgi:hypothetical protein
MISLARRVTHRENVVIDDLPPAYAFVTPLSWKEMRARLNGRTEWHWRDGDSAWLGDYLAAVPVEGGSFRLYEELGYHVLELRRAARAPVWHDVVKARILPLLEATDIKPNSGFD